MSGGKTTVFLQALPLPKPHKYPNPSAKKHAFVQAPYRTGHAATSSTLYYFIKENTACTNYLYHAP